MTTSYDLKISRNPNFDTVNSLTNRTWDPENVPIVSGRGATEDQLQVVDGKIQEVIQNIPECTDDPFTHLANRVRIIEEAFEDCSDDPWTTVKGKLTQLETQQENCCNIPQDEAIAIMKAKINECVAAIQNCCNNTTPVVPIP